ncbi:hypothetical protein [Motiliproteus sp.]|uniref:hypothetical protein n=1 Tax=Motiliproteus sp. TaxID=1898955 RepID=UPI003BABCB0B
MKLIDRAGKAAMTLRENLFALSERVGGWIEGDNHPRALSLLLVISGSVACLIIAIAVLLLGITIWVSLLSGDGNSPGFFNVLGPFGDFIGGILNPILTFIMFISVLFTIVIQSNELKETRKEIARQASSHQEHIKILKKENTNHHLWLAFNESRDKFWQLSKEKIDGGDQSLYFYVMSNSRPPTTEHVTKQVEFMDRKLSSVTLLALELLPNMPKPAAVVLLNDIEDTYRFARKLSIISDDQIKVNLDKIRDKLESESGTSFEAIFALLFSTIFGGPEQSEKTNDNKTQK